MLTQKPLISLLVLVFVVTGFTLAYSQLSREKLSYAGEGYSWTLYYPSSYKLVSKTEKPSSFKRLDISDEVGKIICGVHIDMPTYKVTAVKEKGIENLYEKELQKQENFISSFSSDFSMDKDAMIGNLTGATFEVKRENLHIFEFVAKYPEKNLLGTLSLSCRDIDDAKFVEYKKEYEKIVKSFK